MSQQQNDRPTKKSNIIHIEDHLYKGEENAITSKELSKILGISTRDIFSIVQARRRDGAPICASKKQPYGYFMAKNKAELQKFIDRVEAEAREISITKNVCKAHLDDIED